MIVSLERIASHGRSKLSTHVGRASHREVDCRGTSLPRLGLCLGPYGEPVGGGQFLMSEVRLSMAMKLQPLKWSRAETDY